MLYLSQQDPFWANSKLGASSLTVGRWGCTTTCISMLSDYFDCYKTPLEIAKNANNYTKDGLVIWGNLRFTKMKFARREYGRNDAEIKAALADPNRAVILQVNGGAHWVVAIAKNWLGGDYTIVDPWDAKKKNCIANYRDITGAAYFERINPQPEEEEIVSPAMQKRFKGKLVICPEEHGRLYYVDTDGIKHDLGSNALDVMDRVAHLSEGITLDALNQIPSK